MRAYLCGESYMSTLLNLLKDGQFHSGQALGASLGISRSAVWKQLQQLELDMGLSIHKVRGRGYQLANPLVFLSRSEIEGRREGCEWPVCVFDTLDSTNAEALRAIASGEEVAPFVVVAERQTAGRGRRGRKWVSPFAQNIYYSLALRIDGGMRQIEGLSLVVGLAVLHVLRGEGVGAVGLKWPNDVLVGRKKVAGILLELVGDPADVCHVVLGIGINVNMQLSSEVDQEWSSLRLEAGREIDRNYLVARLNESLRLYLALHEREGFAAILPEWEQHHLWQGQEVCLVAGNNKINGVVLGVDPQGALRLRVGGEDRVFSGGELSLRLRNDS